MARETGNLKAKGKVVERKVIERADVSVMWRSAATLQTHFAQKRAHLSGAQAKVSARARRDCRCRVV